MSTQQNMELSLQKHEQVIEGGLQTFIDVGNALMQIKENRLYKVSYSNFGDYCKERWGFTQQHAGRLISGTNIVNKIKSVPSGLAPPESENQTRALSKSKDPAEDWEKAQKISGKEQPTAREIKEVIRKDEDDVIDVEVHCTVSDPKDAFWVRFAHLLDHPYEFGDTSGRKQIGIDTDDGTVERLEELKNMTGHTKGAIVSQALCLLEEMIALKNGKSSSRK